LSDDGKKRKPIDSEQNPNLKKSRSNNQASRLSQVHDAANSPNGSQCSQVAEPSEPFVDRVLYVQATEPAGRPQADFSSTRELLKAIRDAIEAHRSLFLDRRISHRDVSVSIIVMTEPGENNVLSGSLIDLELGSTVENGKTTRTGLRRMTGTLKYMAIEVLELCMSGARPDLEHTYRHDLESFFYVFLDLCLNCGWNKAKAPKQDPLWAWYVLPEYDNIVRAKLGNMVPTVFETIILPKFSPIFEHVKGLAAKLRGIFFLRESKLRTGTSTEPPRLLYDQMISAFEEAIDADNE
jgi:serine/threonine protein kinase